MSWPRTFACDQHRAGLAIATSHVAECPRCMRRLEVAWERDQDKILELSAEVKHLSDKLLSVMFEGRGVDELTPEEARRYYGALVPKGYRRDEDFGFAPVPVDGGGSPAAGVSFPRSVAEIVLP